MRDCPNGHQTDSADSCHVCGAAISAVRTPLRSVGYPVPTANDPRLAEPGCRQCGNPLAGRFCERCGQDSLSAEADVRPAERSDAAISISWSVVAAADRAYFDTIVAMNGPDASTVSFPHYYPERRFPLRGDRALVGRRDPRRGIDPEIDLSGPPEDLGVSHCHAMLVAQPDGSWAVIDLGSANGTYLNTDHTTPITTNTPVPIGDGGQFHVGAWTVLTLRAHRGGLA